MTPHSLVDGTGVEEVDGASLNTRRDRVEIGLPCLTSYAGGPLKYNIVQFNEGRHGNILKSLLKKCG